MAPTYLPLRERVADASRRLAEAGLFVGTSGNVSEYDADSGLLAITATGAQLARARTEDVTVLDLEGTVIEGSLAPSSEFDLHTGIYRSLGASGMRAVVHTHAPMATALSTVLDELPVIHYQQLQLGGTLRVAPFETFGTPALAAAVGTALEGRLAALMANHGAVTLGLTLDQAVENAELLEWLCTLYHRASAVGDPRPLTAEQQQSVIEHALRTGYGTTKRVDA